MRLSAPQEAPRIPAPDVNGRRIELADGEHPTLLCFFRDPACPFCNVRIFELTWHHEEFDAAGLKIVAVFSAEAAAVQRFVTSKPRPFQVVAMPLPTTLESYGIEKSFWRKLKAILTRVPTLLKGLRIVGLAGLNTTNLMPADFLLDPQGRIVHAWYGKDAGDRIPLDKVRAFLAHPSSPT